MTDDDLFLAKINKLTMQLHEFTQQYEKEQKSIQTVIDGKLQITVDGVAYNLDQFNIDMDVVKTCILDQLQSQHKDTQDSLNYLIQSVAPEPGDKGSSKSDEKENKNKEAAVKEQDKEEKVERGRSGRGRYKTEYSEEMKESIEKDYISGTSIEQLKAKYRLGYNAVRNILDERNVFKPGVKSATRERSQEAEQEDKPSKAADYEVEDLLKKGYTYGRISEETCWTKAEIREYAEKQGIMDRYKKQAIS